MKKALITGLSGQDGSYLAEHLLAKQYQVLGHIRVPNRLGASQHLAQSVSTTSFDLQSAIEWKRCMDSFQPDEIYHLAGISFVPDSWKDPIGTNHANLDVTVHILETLREHPECKMFYACSSEIFGNPKSYPQNESSLIQPQTPYAISKAASYWMMESYRQRYSLFAATGILFNHESPRRDPSFVTRKVSRAAATISLGMQDQLVLGNLDVARDWGFAGDYVDCMHRMLQLDAPEDFTIGTGKLSTLRSVVEIAFETVGLDWRDWVRFDSNLMRPNDNKTIVADCTKAESLLGWRATTSMETLVSMMVHSDLQDLREPSLRKAA